LFLKSLFLEFKWEIIKLIIAINYECAHYQQNLPSREISRERWLDLCSDSRDFTAKENPFGWVNVKGSIDGFEFSKYHLMPMGNGKLFLPVKAEIRKKIKKEAGDTVHIVLFLDQDPLEIPAEFRDCLHDEPLALSFFNALPKRQQEQYVKWIYATKSPEIKIQRLAHAINRLLQSLPCEF